MHHKDVQNKEEDCEACETNADIIRLYIPDQTAKKNEQSQYKYDINRQL